MKCLVTGGCGFIGSTLVDKLVSTGHTVIVVDNLSSDAHEQFYFNDAVKYYKEDVRDNLTLRDIFHRHKPEYVFHLAAEARIQNCMNDPVLAVETNTIGTLNILDCAKLERTKRVMFSSTSAIYGLKNTPPMQETDTPDCLNAYAYSKWFSEGLCKMYSSLYGVDTVCFRYFNVFGDRQPIRGSYAPVIGVFSRQKNAGEPMTIVGDGLQTRDYIHVNDVVSANIKGMLYPDPLNGEVFNVGSGSNYSVLDIAKIMGGVYTYIPARDGEARDTLADTTKIKNKFNWRTTIPMKDWIERTYK